MNKRGITHIEIILSFLIFVGFVIFALYFFSPLENSRFIESSLSYAIKEIDKRAKVNLRVYSVKLPENIPSEDYASVDTPSIAASDSIRVEDYLGEKVNSGKSVPDKKVYFELIEFYQENNAKIAYIKISDGFIFPDSLNSQPDPVETRVAEIISSNEIELISEDKMNELKNSYDNNYKDLKTQFNLPRINFVFSLNGDEGSDLEKIIPDNEEKPPEDIDIYSKEERVEILRSDGRTEFANLIVKIW